MAALNTKHVINAIHTVSIGSHWTQALCIYGKSSNSRFWPMPRPSLRRTITPIDRAIQVTKRLVEAGRILGVDVLDHIVIGDDSYSSLQELGLMWGASLHLFFLADKGRKKH